MTSSYTYDSLGNELTTTSPGNDAAANLTETNNYTTDGNYTQTAAKGQPLTITNSLGKVMHRRYDALGNLTVVSDPLGNETDIAYNIANQILQVTSPATGQTGTGRSIKTYTYLYPSGPLTQTSYYDESGSLTRQISYSFDKEGKQLSRAGSTEPITYAYDAAYRRKSVKDGNGNTTAYTYNTAGYLSNVSYPGHNGAADTVQFPSYRANGQLLKRIDGNGAETDYSHSDSGNLLTDIQYPATPANNVHFTYDGYGRRASMMDGTGTATYAYDDMDALVSVTTTYTGLPSQTISYTYNPDGSRQSMNAPGGSTSYSYDAARRMTGLSGPGGNANWNYLDNDWLWTQSVNAGATTTYTYNAMGLPTRVTNTSGANYGNGATLSDYANLRYDGVTNCTSVTANVPSAAAYSGTTTFAFDNQNQLTQEQSARAGGYTHGFGYDAAQNPTTFKGVAKTFNADNQDTSYTYDGNGNPTVYRGTNLSFDAENRGTAFGTMLTAGYTGAGLRAWKQAANGRTYFLYDGETPVVELNAAGGVTAVNTFGANGLLSRKTPGGTTYYTFDAQGNVAQRLQGGQIVSCLFDAHGAGQTSNGSSDPFGYKAMLGYYTDVETGLLLLTHRYYDTTTGRFLTRDPIGYDGGTNLYGYVHNRPTNQMDKQGTMSLGGAIGLAGCIACAVCLGALLSACSDLDDNETWGQCAIGVISNLPPAAQWFCGGACAVCIVAIIKYVIIGCGVASLASTAPDQQAQSSGQGNVQPCQISCPLEDTWTLCGMTWCRYLCTYPDGSMKFRYLGGDEDGQCPQAIYE